ncbi:S8 family peptidase [Halieaceae bacterium]|nr:S8 family peptidase [Halieaceae bacterium]
MTRRLLLTLFLAGAANAAQASNTEDSLTLLRVMLQGSSAGEMAQLVGAAGGRVTHHLPIINAVGAELSAEQFETIRNSPLVRRYIDDLAVSEQPEETPEEAACQVGAGLELSLKDGELEWALFNKGKSPLTLRTLRLSWPERLGRLQSLSVAERSLAFPENGGKEVVLDDSIPLPPGKAALLARFSEPNASALQSEFTLEAGFDGDCKAELVPGYPNNHGDHYFATVTGAATLHGHGVTGRGVTVAVLDSGLWEHPSLANDTTGKLRIVGRYDAIDNTSGPEVFDESGHGTHMTSIIAHSGAVSYEEEATGSYKGIAPDVRIVAVKAFDVEGQGDFLDIVRGVQWVVDNRERLDIRILNLSFAARPRWPYWLDPINQAIMRAWDAGITVVAAAGNEGPEAMSIGSPGNLPYIITVGAVTDSWTADTRNDDYIPDFSSRGPTPSAHIKPDLVAPGGHMTGLTRPGSTLSEQFPEYHLRTGEFVMTGTSQASALVSGLIALLLQLQPDLSPDDIKCKLITSADLAINRDGRLAYSPFQQGNGYVSVTRAITLGQRGCGNPEMDIRKDMAGEDHYQGPAIMDDTGRVSLPGLEQMYSGGDSEKGPSENRRWGVKAHVEREHLSIEIAPRPADLPFDWERIYLQEKTEIERLANTPAAPEN